jgi:taurine dioxygenase
MTSTLEVRPLTGVLGAEIGGVDLRRPLEGDTVAAIRGALLEHQVIFFREQDMTEEEQLRFAEYFGTPMLSVYDTLAAKQPKITVLDTDAPKGRGTDRWHADHTFSEFPPLGAILRAVEVPSAGGDTCFASMGAAYEALSPTMRDFLDDLTAIHTTELVDAMVSKIAGVVRRSENPPMQHPVVWVHPETGRKLLWVNQNWTTRIVELTAPESEALLGYLYHHLEGPEFQCRFRWEPGSVAFWDNRAVQHFAVPDYHERRVMKRVMMAGTDRPVGPHGQVAHAIK